MRRDAGSLRLPALPLRRIWRGSFRLSFQKTSLLSDDKLFQSQGPVMRGTGKGILVALFVRANVNRRKAQSLCLVDCMHLAF